MRVVDLSGLIGKTAYINDKPALDFLCVGFSTDVDNGLTPTVFLLSLKYGYVREIILSAVTFEISSLVTSKRSELLNNMP